MARYTAKPKSFDDDYPEAWEEHVPGLPDLTDDLYEATETGVLDKDGNKFMKLPDRIGFVRI